MFSEETSLKIFKNMLLLLHDEKILCAEHRILLFSFSRLKLAIYLGEVTTSKFCGILLLITLALTFSF